MSGEAEPAGQVHSWDTNTMPWEIRHIDELDGDLAAKPLITDPDTGMSVMKMKYFAGFTNEWHTHNCAHGIYVLDGILKTHAGSFCPGRPARASRITARVSPSCFSSAPWLAPVGGLQAPTI